MSSSEDKGVVLALIVGMVMITAIVLGVLAFAPLDPFSYEREWRYQEAVDVETVNLSVRGEVCEVRVVFDELSSGWVDVDVTADGRAGFIAGKPEIEFSAVPSLEGANLTVQMSLEMDTGPTVHYSNSVIVVTVHRTLATALTIEVDVGDVRVTVPGNVTLSGLNAVAKVGAVHLSLAEGANVQGDVILVAKVGSVNMRCENAEFADGTKVGLETATGSINLDIEQTMSPGGNVTFDCAADVGSVYLTLRISGDIASEITSQANVGKVNTDLVGFSGMDVHLVSDNHPDVWNVDITLMADVGSVNIDAEWRE